MRAAIRTLSVYHYGDRITAGRRKYISSIGRLTQYNCNKNQNHSVGCIRRRTTDTNCQFSSFNNNINGWKYSYRSNQIRRFASGTNNTKFNPTNDDEHTTDNTLDEFTNTLDEEQQLTNTKKEKKYQHP